MNRQIYLASLLLFLVLGLSAQDTDKLVQGKVTEVAGDETIPLVGANVYWLGTQAGTSTKSGGHFNLLRVPQTDQLVISFIGYQTDTIDTKGKDVIEIRLNAAVSLDEVKVVYRKKTTEISFTDPLKVEKIGEDELLKAACCNLSESFETSPSVDVSFTDAVTGTRQIQMLGLAGPYTQITRENMPDIRGLSAIYGLTYIPGTWVEGIQLIKGPGSVVNGYESIAGQVNVEIRKPETAEKLYLNLYGNEGGRMEFNANFAHRMDDGKWSTAVLLHGKKNSRNNDRNQDGFLDHPLSNQFIGLNRWKYIGPGGVRLQFGVKGTYIDNIGGQVGFDPEQNLPVSEKWGMHLNMQRIEGWAKLGKVFIDMPWKSIALQISGANHRQISSFGLHDYDAEQHTFYANTLYQSILSNTYHKFKTGLSLQYDKYAELWNNTNFDRTEIVSGAYFEYTYSPSEDFSAVAGIRADYHNLFGSFITPRIQLRYAISDNTVVRGSAGRGQRTGNILSEYNGLLASSRQLIIQSDDSEKPYGLNPEVAWNYGINLTKSFQLDYRDGTVSFDYYRTDFENQIVVDLDQSPQTAVFYNLQGDSYSNSFQAQLDYEAVKRLDVRLAYRWFDVQTTYSGKLLQKPLIAAHRAFLNAGYETHNQWKFDYTINWQGEKRIPNTEDNPMIYQLPEYSPDFVVMNAQISKLWKEKFEVYLGVENLLNFTQNNPILASEQPFGPHFDSSLIWGPIFGRNVYFGLRYRIK